MQPVTTFTLFQYQGLSNKFWALSQMGLAPRKLGGIPGLTFYKLLGTGSRGFSAWPEWGIYGLLQVWETESAATTFFESHPQMQAFLSRSVESLRLFMRPLRSRGLWDGKNPFETGKDAPSGKGPVAVITRATIRKRYLYRFWSYVPQSRRPLQAMRGLVYSKGIGETPFIDMATFSLWEDTESMERYAYGTAAHQGAIRRTRELGWYREELFARFQPYRIEGSWKGIRDLEALRRLVGRMRTAP